MKIQINKQNLLKCVQAVQNAVSTKTTLPILSHFLVETTEGGIKITGTDLDIGISSHAAAQIDSQGSTTVPAKKFSDIIKELPESTVTIEVKKNNMVTIECEKSFFKMMGLAKEEFPQFPDFIESEMIILPQQKLRWMLITTAFAMSHEENRFVLNGVLLCFKKNRLEIVATDGRRLAFIEREVGNTLGLEKTMVIPAKTVQELIRSLNQENETAEVKIIFGERQVMFEIDKLVIISRLIEGEYPNYHQVIPTQIPIQIKMNREQLLLATKRVGLFTYEESRAIKLDLLKNKMVISKNSPQLGEAREEIPIEYTGENFSIGFNPLYLIDVLKCLEDEQIQFGFTGVDKPGVITAKDQYIYVVLPMQLV